MRKLLYGIAFIFSFAAQAQYIPGSAQPFQLAPLYNPAFSGIENFGDLKFAYRYQWAAFKDNAPQFGNLSYTMRIKQPINLKVNALRTSRSDFQNVVPKSRLNIQGLGVHVFSEKYGPINRMGGGMNYALHMPISKKFFLSGGIGAVVENTRLKTDELYFGENPDMDQFMDELLSGSSNHTELWTRGGILLYSPGFYIGGAYYPWSTSLATSEVEFNNPFYKGNFQAGFTVRLNEDFLVKPSVFALWQTDGKLLIDYSAKLFLQDKAWVGLTYRDIKGGIGSAGFNINEKFSIGYSFEFTLGKLRSFTGSTHDLVLAMRVNNIKRVNQYTW